MKYAKIQAFSDTVDILTEPHPYFPVYGQNLGYTGKYGYDSVKIRENTNQKNRLFWHVSPSVYRINLSWSMRVRISQKLDAVAFLYWNLDVVVFQSWNPYMVAFCPLENALGSRCRGLIVSVSRCRDVLVPESRSRSFWSWNLYSVFFWSWDLDIVVYVFPRPRFRFHCENRKNHVKLFQLYCWRVFKSSKFMQQLSA